MEPEQLPIPMERWIALQEKEVEARLIELELEKQKESNIHEISQQSIKAELQDRENDRNFFSRETRKRMIFMSCLLLMALVFVGVLAALGKDDLATILIERGLFVGVGGLGGYGFGYYTGRRRAQAQTKTNDHLA